MISHIKTKGFKGQDIDEAVSPKTIYIGPNGSGKSTRVQAIALVVMGYIPWATKPKKTPAPILDAYGSGKTLTVTAVIADTEFERKFSRAESGSVSQKLRINRRGSSKDEFAGELVRAGSPKILDLGAFIDLSDQKKIDLIFSLFPPAGDVAGLDADIESKTDELNALNLKSKGINGAIKQLISGKSSVEMPGGTLAEVQEEIKTLLAQVGEAQETLKEAELEQARIDGEEKAKKDEEERKKLQAIEDVRLKEEHREQQLKQAQPEEPARCGHDSSANTWRDTQSNTPSFLDKKQDPEKTAPSAILPTPPITDPAESILAILRALESAGCRACAARLVAKRELKKYQRRAAA